MIRGWATARPAVGLLLFLLSVARTAISDRARRTAFLPQRDPDASGHALPAITA